MSLVIKFMVKLNISNYYFLNFQNNYNYFIFIKNIIYAIKYVDIYINVPAFSMHINQFHDSFLYDKLSNKNHVQDNINEI